MTGQPVWPLASATCHLLVVVVGGWILIHTPGASLAGLAAVTAAGLAVMGIVLAVSFRLYARLAPQGRGAP